MSPLPRAITFDLDDTLWPIAPVIERAEAELHAWLGRHAPQVAQRYDIQALRLLRDEVARDRPEWAHDFTRIRHYSLSLALQECGHDAALADAAFAAFFEVRNQLEPFEGVDQALAALSARWPLLALTNGNADLARLPLGRHFQGTVSAREFGMGKPDRRIFAEACRRLGCEPGEVLHVGDDWRLDVQGALDAGLRAVWLRHPHMPLPEAGAGSVPLIGHVRELCGLLGLTQ